MRANELRLGNIVSKEGRPSLVDLNDFKMIYNGSWPIWKPIHITDNWMIKLGFKKVKSNGVYWYEKKLGKYKPVLVTNDIGEFGFSEKLKFVFIDEYDNIKLKYVHQIQNLYFSLTQTELTLKS